MKQLHMMQHQNVEEAGETIDEELSESEEVGKPENDTSEKEENETTHNVDANKDAVEKDIVMVPHVILFSIKTFNDVHTCAKEMKNPNITSKFIVKTYLHKFQTDRNYALSSLKADIEANNVAILNATKCLRARKLALKMIDGRYKDQFKKLYEYLRELSETNPGTTTIC
ncbi:hypothetical protein V6N13_005041 [Hibiscus sabdariffa]